MKLEVLDKENKKVSEYELDDSLLVVTVKDDLIHDVLLAYEQNQHTGSSNTLGRGQVRGGGKKPWKQKGTGQARHGSIRSPIWKGGGVTFGPKPFKSRIVVNKAVKKQAFYAVLAGKLRDNEIKLVSDFSVTAPKTKEVIAILKSLKLHDKKLLLVMDAVSANFIKASRNIEKLTVVKYDNVNVFEMISHKNILMTQKALDEIIKRKG
ncbi:MAG: 50S ribosomal protein L4 [bacterium]